MKARDYINNLKPNTVDNWSNQASLLSYSDVAELMDMYAELVAEYVYNHFDDSSSKTAKDYLQDFLSQ